MKYFRNTGAAGTLIAISATAQPALADVTAEEVWANWTSYLTSFGYGLETSREMVDGVLTISDITMRMDVPEDESTVTVSLGDITLTEKGDGTVAVDLPYEMPIVINVAGPDVEEADITLEQRTTGFSMVVSGAPGDMTYTYSAAGLSLALVDLVVEDEPVDIGRAGIDVTNLSGLTQVRGDTVRELAQKVSTGQITYMLDINDPEGGDGRLIFEGGMESLQAEAEAAVPMDVDLEDMAAATRAGFAVKAGYETGPGQMNFSFQDDDETMQGATTSDGGTLEMAIDESELFYGAGIANLTLQLAGSEVPMPLEAAAESFGYELLMPVSKSDEPQEFGITALLDGFTMSEMIWGIFDPDEELPRDPATVEIEMSGEARLTSDLLDTAQMEALDEGDAPGELHSLNLESLVLRAVGAELTGEGAFTFDNTDLESYDGVPAPIGEVNLNLAGGNTLLDTLVGMGLMPEEQANGMRMMMGLFAVPGDAPDTLTSKIEFTKDKQVLANGQRLK